MRQGPSVLSNSGTSSKSAICLFHVPQTRTRVGLICEGICWAVSDARTDKTTGYTGERRVFSAYVSEVMSKAMRKWQ